MSSYLLGDVYELEKGAPHLLFAATQFGEILVKKYQIFQGSFITFRIFSVVFQRSPQVVLSEKKKNPVHISCDSSFAVVHFFFFSYMEYLNLSA